MVKSRHPEVDDPLSIPVDEESLVLSGRGRPHGRYPFLNKAVKPTPATSYTRLKHTLTADSPQPRPRPARPPAYDVSFPHFHPLSGFPSYMAKCLRDSLFLKL